VGRFLLFSLLTAVVVFAIVQDRVTADGARRFVTLQRSALASGRSPVAIEDVMRPAIRRSVEQGALWGGLALLVGAGAARVTRNRSRE
jgi:hypothetical protein